MAHSRSDWPAKGIGFAQLALLALIAFVLVKAVLTFVSPQSVWKAVGPAPVAASAQVTTHAPVLNPAFDPFYRNRAAAPVAVQNTIGEDAPETTLDLKLFGLRSDIGDSGSAILQTPDRQQKTYRIDDEIISGVFLRAVNKDYIVLEADGQLERLTFIKPESGLSRPAPEPVKSDVFASGGMASAGRPGKYSPAQIMAAIRLAPVSGPSGSVTGFRVTPRGHSSLLKQAGLQSGDVITAINGQSLNDPASVTAMAAKLSRAQNATLTLSRNNTPMTVKIGR